MTDQTNPTTTARDRSDVDARLYGLAPKATAASAWSGRNRSGINAGDVNIPGLIGWLNRRSPWVFWVGLFVAVGVVGSTVCYLLAGGSLW